MAITRWSRDGLIDPVEAMARLQREINSLFDFDSGESASGLFDRASTPAMDVEETPEEFWVSCDLPGVEQRDLEVSISNNILTVKGHKESRRGKGRIFRDEIWSGDFQRTLSLPSTADPGRITAELKNGVLSIRFPKREEVKPKQITVNVK
jgi:HSP20 family protein